MPPNASTEAMSIQPIIISSQLCGPQKTVAEGFGLNGLFTELSKTALTSMR